MIADQQRPIPPRADVILVLEMLAENGNIKKMVRFNSAPVELPERPSSDMVAQEGPVDCYQYNSEY